MYTTLVPCPMCTGAMLLYGIKRVVYACRTNVTTQLDTVALLEENGVECVYMPIRRSEEILDQWIKENNEIYQNEPWAISK